MTLWDIGRPAPPSYKGVPRRLLRVAAEMTPNLYRCASHHHQWINILMHLLHSMAWVKEQKWLLAGTESGLIGWNLPTKVLTRGSNRLRISEFTQNF